MNFGELRFWLLLAAGLSLIFIGRVLLSWIAPARLGHYDKVGLAALGLFLLLCVSFTTFIIYVVVLSVTYIGLNWIVRYSPGKKFRWLTILIPLQLTPLIYYKYAGFIYNNTLGFAWPSFL